MHFLTVMATTPWQLRLSKLIVRKGLSIKQRQSTGHEYDIVVDTSMCKITHKSHNERPREMVQSIVHPISFETWAFLQLSFQGQKCNMCS